MTVDNDSQFYTPKPNYRWRIIFALTVGLIAALLSIYSLTRYQASVQKEAEKATKTVPARVAVTALGRIEPQGEVRRLSAPSSLSGVRVEKVLIKDGESVRIGQVVAWLEGYARTAAALQQAIDKVSVARAKLLQIKAGAKTGDISAQKATISRLQAQVKGEVAAQQATIARLQAQLNNARTENNRYQQIYKQGAVSASIADTKRLQLQTVEQQIREAQAGLTRTVSTLQDQIQEAQAKLASLSEVRPVDVQLAEAEVKSAISAVTQSQAEHELTYVKSPINSKILKIHAKSGEVIGSNGIVELGTTSQMYVVAEVYQTDVEKVRIGQKALITSTAFSGKIPGTVNDIGLQIERQSILSVNPSADTDRRVVEVKIRIDNPSDSKRVAGLTNLQVDVAIHI
ncbi:ABC exporter membrane fusion protein [Brunnivagina elsteri]|uniref:HlyD family secretion protein n=1 Tax=Brunnivagina elsteri CCALA 953 TaxID=987040 RepID=A0A2A2TPW0_9CYAN|nr:ABC exporter membrane fusion protein [Calothrix elsteri]PAX60561.1 HlyD family secretion protein [Calothrix elsteri CCALA 953]